MCDLQRRVEERLHTRKQKRFCFKNIFQRSNVIRLTRCLQTYPCYRILTAEDWMVLNHTVAGIVKNRTATYD